MPVQFNTILNVKTFIVEHKMSSCITNDKKTRINEIHKSLVKNLKELKMKRDSLKMLYCSEWTYKSLGLYKSTF